MMCLTDEGGGSALAIRDWKTEGRVSRQGTYQYLLVLLLETHDAGRPVLDESFRAIHAVIHLVNASTVRRLWEGIRVQ